MTAVPGLPTRDSSYMQTAFSILDNMIDRGNVVARYRKEELEKLQEMLRLAKAQNHAPLASVDSRNNTNVAHDETQLSVDNGNVSQAPSTEQFADRGPATGSTANGLASEQMLSIAGLLDWEPDMTAFGEDQLSGNWLWTDSIAPDFDFSGALL
ncbi:uncharacterized protein ColSpa_03533 [Colletotrichum spaethianum]|uniref:Uncharacterized protein n=1 Tax=Colletotrichum spaethianum TaxID=700344 RepID=A0AA37L7Q2_9PEZI|nr:uncharacterized protein ColSpa_03533 [Colletotrichum spaethianum]GKT43352.1 hypothetical protein ColSpa_03533 [Colletotrichum spaethianum]